MSCILSATDAENPASQSDIVRNDIENLSFVKYKHVKKTILKQRYKIALLVSLRTYVEWLLDPTKLNIRS